MKDSNNKTPKKKKKRHLKFKGFIFLILLLYLISMTIYYLLKMPVKNIVIKNNNLVTENEILETVNVSFDSSLFKLSKRSLKKKLLSNELIYDAKITKTFLGDLIIDVTENKILFYNESSHKLVLSSKDEMDENSKYLGYPTLINYVPSDILDSFILKFKDIDLSVIKMISEIEYSVDEYNGTVLDDKRFLLRMNDGNSVYINIANMEKLNNYMAIISSIFEKGTLYLDSSSSNYIFKTQKEVLENENEN